MEAIFTGQILQQTEAVVRNYSGRIVAHITNDGIDTKYYVTYYVNLLDFLYLCRKGAVVNWRIQFPHIKCDIVRFKCEDMTEALSVTVQELYALAWRVFK